MAQHVSCDTRWAVMSYKDGLQDVAREEQGETGRQNNLAMENAKNFWLKEDLLDTCLQGF